MKSNRKARTQVNELAARALDTKQLRAVGGGMCIAFESTVGNQCKIDYECWNGGE